MTRLFLLATMLLTAACGVQGDLYLPDQPAPVRDRDKTPDPFPTLPPEEQIPLPDLS